MNIEQYGWTPIKNKGIEKTYRYDLVIKKGLVYIALITFSSLPGDFSLVWTMYDYYHNVIGSDIPDLEQYIIDNELYSDQYKRNEKLKQLGL